MEVEKIRKMGELSKELRKHGFAESSDDALKQTEQIYKENYLGEEIMQAKPPEIAEAQREAQEQTQENQTQAPTTESTSPQLLTEHIERIEKVEKDVLRIFEKMNEIIKTINLFEEKFDKIQVAGAEEKPKETQTKIPEPEKKTESPRSGDYKPKDVEIDKIFYYGNK